MGIRAINWATRQRVGNATAKHALLWLAFHANEKSGECFPSVELLMEEMEVGSKNTVKAALKTLIDAGLISSKREMKGNRVSRTFYRLNLDGAISDPSNIDGLNIDRSNIDADGSNFDGHGSISDRVMGQPLTPNKEVNKEVNKERNRGDLCALPGAPQPPPMSDEDLENLFANAQLEECPPFPEKGEHPPFEKGVRLPDVSEKGDHLSTATKHRATTRRKPSTPCPFDMESSIPDEYLGIAKKAGIGDPQRVFSAFVNHALAHDRRLVIWPAGFRTWCSNEIRYHPNQTPKPKPLHQRTADDYNW